VRKGRFYLYSSVKRDREQRGKNGDPLKDASIERTLFQHGPRTKGLEKGQKHRAGISPERGGFSGGAGEPAEGDPPRKTIEETSHSDRACSLRDGGMRRKRGGSRSILRKSNSRVWGKLEEKSSNCKEPRSWQARRHPGEVYSDKALRSGPTRCPTLPRSCAEKEGKR